MSSLNFLGGGDKVAILLPLGVVCWLVNGFSLDLVGDIDLRGDYFLFGEERSLIPALLLRVL